MLLDITRTLGLDTLTWPGDPSFHQRTISSIASGDQWEQTQLRLTDHTGTHIDFPAHFNPEGRSIDQVPLERIFGVTAHVVEFAADRPSIRPEDVSGLALQPGEAVLLKTLNSQRPRDRVASDYMYLEPQAAEILTQKGPSLIGIDYLSVDAFHSTDYPSHRLLLERNILILEDLDLAAVTPGQYRLYCLPLKVTKTSGAPCRVVLELQA